MKQQKTKMAQKLTKKTAQKNAIKRVRVRKGGYETLAPFLYLTLLFSLSCSLYPLTRTLLFFALSISFSGSKPWLNHSSLPPFYLSSGLQSRRSFGAHHNQSPKDEAAFPLLSLRPELCIFRWKEHCGRLDRPRSSPIVQPTPSTRRCPCTPVEGHFLSFQSGFA